ncbi:hypothetical protein BAMA_10390 [Bacillus manliponensis]|uniref:DUF3895 domain-containing protein n=1 Tax=Bacillus manliponensis TaxID=574376 RepID=A0A073JUI4_9BACI|nr:hypothetical protein BAMA_10390 [Bacillus manliponensis]
MLSKEEREGILNSISSKQKEFIQEHVKRGKKTVFANIMAKDKGVVLPANATNEELEMLLDEWVLEEYIDNGFVNPETKCECGRPLRYQYIVKHKRTNEVRRFGIDHFEQHTGIPGSIVREIKQGFYEIDYEMDELLFKINNSWSISEVFPTIPDNYIFPKDIATHLEAEVPLLDRQIKRLRDQIREFLLRRENQKEQQEQDADEQDEFDYKLTNEDEQFSFGLFDENVEFTKQNIRNRSGYNKQESSSLSSYLKDEALNYIKNNVSSARVICELLIKNHGAYSQRYTTGKPKIYVSVCSYLDSLVQDNILTVEKPDITDRAYQLID